MAAKEFIVAIELGSSKITGIAGRKSTDGSLQVLAVVREDATSCIHKGVVYNIDKTCVCLTDIITKLKTLLRSEISMVYVGIGGQSIRCICNSSVKNLPEDTIISQDIINELMDNNRCTEYPDLEILDVATQEFKVDTFYQADPVGIQSDKIEGNFLNIVCRKTFYRNLYKCFEKANITIAEMYLSPIALAHSILTEAEMRIGCLLVDLGASTTTVSVYHKNILRHLAVIPLGGNNITKDITTLLMDENEAEEMKIKYATAITDPTETEPDATLPIDDERSVSAKVFNELVEARVSEIIHNVWFGQVPSKYSNRLIGGIILTGGGSKMKGIKKAFADITGIYKIRIAGTVSQKVTSTDEVINAKDGTMCTALGLLAKGDMNCSGATIKPTADLFDTERHAGDTAADSQRTKDGKPGETGQVESPEGTQCPVDKHRPEEKPTQKELIVPPNSGWWSRRYNSLVELFTKIISAEPDDDTQR